MKRSTRRALQRASAAHRRAADERETASTNILRAQLASAAIEAVASQPLLALAAIGVAKEAVSYAADTIDGKHAREKLLVSGIASTLGVLFTVGATAEVLGRISGPVSTGIAAGAGAAAGAAAAAGAVGAASRTLNAPLEVTDPEVARVLNAQRLGAGAVAVGTGLLTSQDQFIGQEALDKGHDRIVNERLLGIPGTSPNEVKGALFGAKNRVARFLGFD